MPMPRLAYCTYGLAKATVSHMTGGLCFLTAAFLTVRTMTTILPLPSPPAALYGLIRRRERPRETSADRHIF